MWEKGGECFLISVQGREIGDHKCSFFVFVKLLLEPSAPGASSDPQRGRRTLALPPRRPHFDPRSLAPCRRLTKPASQATMPNMAHNGPIGAQGEGHRGARL
jgi:hypothetical protein